MRMYDRPLWSLTAAGISLGDGLGPPPAAGPLSFRPPAQYDPGDGRMVPTRQGRSARRSSRGQSLYHARTTRWRSFADGTGSHSIPRRNSPRAPGQTDPVPKQPEGAGSYPTPRRNMPEGAGHIRSRAETASGRRVLPDPAPKHARGRRVVPDPVPAAPPCPVTTVPTSHRHRQVTAHLPSPTRRWRSGTILPSPTPTSHPAAGRPPPRHMVERGPGGEANPAGTAVRSIHHARPIAAARAQVVASARGRFPS